MANIMRFSFSRYGGPNPRDIKLVLAGLLLLCGATVALKVPVGGQIICTQGQCEQSQYAAFGRETDSWHYGASAIEAFSIETNPANALLSRVIATVHGQPTPLTRDYGSDGAEIERIANYGNQFIEGDRNERLTLRYEERALVQLLALVLLLTGSALGGWLYHQRLSE